MYSGPFLHLFFPVCFNLLDIGYSSSKRNWNRICCTCMLYIYHHLPFPLCFEFGSRLFVCIYFIYSLPVSSLFFLCLGILILAFIPFRESHSFVLSTPHPHSFISHLTLPCQPLSLTLVRICTHIHTNTLHSFVLGFAFILLSSFFSLVSQIQILTLFQFHFRLYILRLLSFPFRVVHDPNIVKVDRLFSSSLIVVIVIVAVVVVISPSRFDSSISKLEARPSTISNPEFFSL